MINSATELVPHDSEFERHFAAHLARLSHGVTVALAAAAGHSEIAPPESLPTPASLPTPPRASLSSAKPT
jgi:hypothetical protein